PISADPSVHALANADIRSDSHQEHIAAAAGLIDAGDAVVLHVRPSENRADEPFAPDVFRFIGPVGQPKARFDVGAEAGSLRALGAKEGMKILIGHEAPDVEEPGVGPVGGNEKIGGAGTWLESGGQEVAIGVG